MTEFSVVAIAQLREEAATERQFQAGARRAAAMFRVALRILQRAALLP